MPLYFAYGSNMSRALMRTHCPAAKAQGTAVLDGHRFIVTSDGYASVVPAPGKTVNGVLWQLTPRDVAALNIYEDVQSGLYRAVILPVRAGNRCLAPLVYVARSRIEGRPKPGYLEIVVSAARDWDFSDGYVASLARWAPSGLKTARVPESGEIA